MSVCNIMLSSDRSIIYPFALILGLWTLCLFCVLQNSGRSISGILARPLPKGAGLRQGSLVSDIITFSDTRNAQITQNLSAVKTEGSPAPNLSAFAITSANNPSVTVPKNSVLFYTSLTWYSKQYRKRYTTLWQLPLHKGAKCDTSVSQFALNPKRL